MERALTLTFITESGDKSSLTISGVKEGLTNEEITALMDIIVEKKAFISKNGLFVDSYSAKVTTKETEKFDIKGGQ